jgi:hypothetical protein
MPRPKRYQDRPATVGSITGCPYRSLIAAILERAMADALGRGIPADLRQDEARAWLSGRGAEALLELAGYESAVILRRLRQRLDG